MLAGNKADVCVLVEVSRETLWNNVIIAGRNVAIECAAILDRSKIGAVHVDIGEIKALGRQPGTVEPDPGLARWNRNLSDWRPLGAARRDRQKGACP